MRLLYMNVCFWKNLPMAEPVESCTRMWATPDVASGSAALGVHVGLS